MAQGEYPGVMLQELDQIVAGVYNSNRFTFTFPAVPQGLAWTGMISIAPTYGSIFSPAHLNETVFNQDFALFQNAEFILLRNNIPILWWQGVNQAYNVRATNTDVITLVVNLQAGARQTIQDSYQARWVGQSVPVDNSAFAWPTVGGPSNGPVQVFTNPAGPVVPGSSGPVFNAFQVVTYPIPSTVATVELDIRLRPPTASSAVLLPIANGGIAGMYLWGVTLSATAAQLSTVTGEQDWLVSIETINASTPVCALNLGTVPGTTANDSVTIPTYGTPIAAGDGLKVAWTAYGGTMGGWTATAVYTVNNGNNPG